MGFQTKIPHEHYISCMASNQARSENYGDPNAKWMRFNRVNCLVYVLHESARSFSQLVQHLQWHGKGRMSMDGINVLLIRF
jgi:hypothetical protein